MLSRTVRFVSKSVHSGLVAYGGEMLVLYGFGELRSIFFALARAEIDAVPTRDAGCRYSQIVAQVIIKATRSCHKNLAIVWPSNQKTLHTLYAKRLIH